MDMLIIHLQNFLRFVTDINSNETVPLPILDMDGSALSSTSVLILPVHLLTISPFYILRPMYLNHIKET